MNSIAADILWLLLAAGLVFLMQAGFLCLETGLTRSKNNINVAIKNLADFGASTFAFWLFGFAFMFGLSRWGWLGVQGFMPDLAHGHMWSAAFFLFQVMFCGTAVTILSGAVAERLRFSAYLILAILVSGVTYPIFGHWAWNGLDQGASTGWLGALGFIDFAGSTVVHSVGGWTALAVLLIIGARHGRFPADQPPQKIAGADIPLATLGVLLLYIGWIGFNGGSTLTLNDQVPGIVANTVMAGATGLLAALLASRQLNNGRVDVNDIMNGTLAGLVAITAGCFAVTTAGATLIGAIGGVVMIVTGKWLESLKIDDAVGAIPVHLAAGVWGTLAVGLLGDLDVLGTGYNRWQQTGVQLLGVVVCGVWVFGLTYIVMKLIDRFKPLRISPEAELIGLNMSEHGAKDPLLDLVTVMTLQAEAADWRQQAPVEPFTEAGRIATYYNRVMQALQTAVAHTESIVANALDGIITFSQSDLTIVTLNPAAEQLFGYNSTHLIGHPVTHLLPTALADTSLPLTRHHLEKTAAAGVPIELAGQHAAGFTFPVEVSLTESHEENGDFYIGFFRNISERKELAEAQHLLASRRITDEFLAMVNHEMRTPISAILVLAEMLAAGAGGTLSEHQSKTVRRIIHNAGSMGRLVGSLLDQAQLELGQLNIELAPYELAPLLENIRVGIGPRLEEKGLRFETLVAPDMPTVLMGDAVRVEQIVANLVNNAIKFTDEGCIEVRIWLDNYNMWAISVRDTGPGIPDEAQATIFDAFQRWRDASKFVRGVGLGLSVVKQLVTLMEGSITVQSKVGHGSVFTVKLPLLPVVEEEKSCKNQLPL